MVVTLAVLGAAACSTPAPLFDPQRADIVAARGAGRVHAADGLAAMTRPLLVAESATIDSCVPGLDSWKIREPWSQRCWFSYAGVVVVPDMDRAATVVHSGLVALGCNDPNQLAELLHRWGEINPGEPLPADGDFVASVLPPQLSQCGDREVWIRFSTPTDSLLEVVGADAASSRDPIVVSARPFSDPAFTRLRAQTGGVIMFVTVRTMYHQEPR